MKKRELLQYNLFADEDALVELADGSLIDARQVADIEAGRYYKVSQVAQLLDCTINTVYALCSRLPCKNGDKQVDSRFFNWVRNERKYAHSELARRWNCSHEHINNLRRRGLFEHTPVGSMARIPGWSVRKFIFEHASNAGNLDNQLEFLKLGPNLIVVPGWAFVEYVSRNCSRL